MANIYGKPIAKDVSITPRSMPTELLEKGLINQQKRYDDILTTAEAFSDQIGALSSRPGVESDSEYLNNTLQGYNELKTNYYDSIGGDFSTTQLHKIKDIASDYLQPRKDVLTAIQTNYDLYNQRKALKTEYDALGLTLDFDDSLETGASFDDQGNPIIYKSTGVEKRGDWLGAINNLFNNIKSSSVQTLSLDESLVNNNTVKSIVNKSYSESTNEGDLVIGNRTIESNKIKNIVDNQINEFIDTNAEGNQMYRWFKKYYKEQYLKENPDADMYAAEAYADNKSKIRIKEAISDISFNYAQTDIASQLTEKLLEVDSGDSKSKLGSDDVISAPPVLGSPVLTYINPTDKSLEELEGEGTGYSYISSESQILNAPFNPNNINWTEDFSTINSIDSAIGSLLYVGPRDKNDLQNPTTAYQFEGLDVTRQGYLQKLDTEETNGRYAGSKNRTAYTLDNSDISKYISYLESNNTNGRYTKLIDELQKVNDRGESYVISSMDIKKDDLGRYEIVPNPFFEQLSEEELNKVQANIEAFKKDHAASISARFAHIQALESKKQALKQRHIEARRKAGFVNEKEFQSTLKMTDNNTSEQYKELKEKEQNLYITSTGVINDKHIRQLRKLGDEYYDAVLEMSKDAIASGKTFNTYIASEYGSKYGTSEFWSKFLDKYDLNNSVDANTFNEFGLNSARSILSFYVTAPPISNAFPSTKSVAELYEANSSDFYRDNATKFDSRLKAYYDALDRQLDPTYISNMRLHIDTNTTDSLIDNKQFRQAILSAAITNGMYFIRPEDSTVSEEEKITVQELRDRRVRELGDKENLDKFLDQPSADNLEILGIRIDPGTGMSDDSIVVDISIEGKSYEIRGVKGIERILDEHQVIDQKFLNTLNEFNDSLRNNEYTYGQFSITSSDDDSIMKTFNIYMAQFNDENTTIYGTNNTLQKNQFYIYGNDSKRIGFSSAEEAIQYLTSQNEKDVMFRQIAGTPLALSDEDFKLTYGIDKESYRKEYESQSLERGKKNMAVQIVTGLGLTANDVYMQNDNHYIKLPTNSEEYFTQSGYNSNDLKQIGNNYTIDIKNYTSENLPDKLQLKQGIDKASMIPVFERAFNDLPDNIPSQTITNSRRSLQEHIDVWSNATDPTKTPKFSDHMYGQAIDIRSTDDNGLAFVEFLQSEEGIKWMQKHNLRALVHDIGGSNAPHIHLTYNVDILLPNGKTVSRNNQSQLIIED